MIVCPRCGHDNPDKARNCSKCDINLNYALENAKVYETERLAKELELRKYQNLILTTTPSVEGKTISQYIGITSSVVVIGTGFVSELSGNIADFFGTRASGFQEKLSKARELVLNEMKAQAFQCDGEGIVGITLDYMTFQGNMIMVSGSGTVIKFTTQEK